MKKLSLVADAKICKNTAAVLQDKNVLTATVLVVCVLGITKVSLTYINKDREK